MSAAFRAAGIVRALATLAFVNLLAACSSLPPLADRTSSSMIADTTTTTLGRAVSALTPGHPQTSGIHSLGDPLAAFAARMLLVRAAQRSLDVQVYIWRRDLTGSLLIEALRTAADRGVRVRLLLDDNNTGNLDEVLATLDGHANIEVRLFNPFVPRGMRLLGYLTDFSRANRRMHNKSFTADNQVTIIGGRNIGDEYFGATDATLFIDLDVLAIGPVVSEVSRDFDRYWRSDSSYPAARLLAPAAPAQREAVAAEALRLQTAPQAASYLGAVRDSVVVDKLERAELSLNWAPTRLVSDDPAKGLGRAPEQAMLPAKLQARLGPVKRSLDIVSPYFVPTDEGVAGLTALAAQQVKVRVLTNSLAATDVAPVHSGYARHRKALLQSGIELHELRAGAVQAEPQKTALLGGSSASSLHAKTFIVDGEHVYVGSFNFDPRSADLNTELGFVIDSPTMARQMSERFSAGVAASAYRLRLTDAGQLQWLEQRDGATVTHDTEPATGILLRLWIGLLSLLPIEGLL